MTCTTPRRSWRICADRPRALSVRGAKGGWAPAPPPSTCCTPEYAQNSSWCWLRRCRVQSASRRCARRTWLSYCRRTRARRATAQPRRPRCERACTRSCRDHSPRARTQKSTLPLAAECDRSWSATRRKRLSGKAACPGSACARTHTPLSRSAQFYCPFRSRRTTPAAEWDLPTPLRSESTVPLGALWRAFSSWNLWLSLPRTRTPPVDRTA